VDQFGARISPAEENRRTAELDRQLAAANRRLHVKEETASRLLTGELTLFEAAALFGTVERAPESEADFPRLIHPGVSEGEKLCRAVISWAGGKVQVERSSAEAGDLRRRLEAELREHMDCYGTVNLLE
jgi:hypothetical protein